MIKNVGSTDKIIRVIAGALLLVLPFVSGLAAFENPSVMIGSLVVGAVLIGTGLFNFCPLYRVLGLRTCKV